MNHSRRYTARSGRWLPAEPKHLNDWLTKVIEAAEQKKAPFHPVVEEFRAMIENDPEMLILAEVSLHRAQSLAAAQVLAQVDLETAEANYEALLHQTEADRRAVALA
jgi:multidrug resistance efflux pump